MPEWLQQELSVQMAPVDAPDALRDRVLRPVQVMPARRVPPLLIAAAMVVLSAGTVWLASREPAPAAPSPWKASSHNCLLCHTS